MRIASGVSWLLLGTISTAGQPHPPLPSPPLASPVAAELPMIATPRPSDAQYTAQQNELERWYQELRGTPQQIAPTLYRYRLPNRETAIQIAATFALPYESIVTLNHLYNNDPLPAGSEVLIPSAPGLYIDLNPRNDFEQLLYILRIEAPTGEPGNELTVQLDGQEYQYRFLAGAQFSTTERSAFFNRLFHVPIRNGRVSSLFGARQDPLTGANGFHNGIDIAAPLATSIRAAQEGRVVETQNDDPIYGNFITIEHTGGFTTTYAHLESISTTAGAAVTISSQIGTVGNTGHSTGPHIHFEIALNGRALDPLSYMYIPSSYLIDDAEQFKRIETDP